jgi:hypothetical protein
MKRAFSFLAVKFSVTFIVLEIKKNGTSEA